MIFSVKQETLGQQQLRPFGLQWAISKLHKWLITGEMCHVRLRLDHWTESSQGICPPEKKLWKVDVFYLLETCLFRSKKKWSPLSWQPMCFESFLLSSYPCLLATRLSNHRHRLLPNPPVSSHEFPVETTASHGFYPPILPPSLAHW